MKVDATFHTLFGAMLLECAYSGSGPDGWIQGVPPKGPDGRRLFPVPEAATNDVECYLSLSPYFAGYSHAFELFEDTQSCQLMTLLMTYRILGSSRVRLPITPESYENSMRTFADPLLIKSHSYDVNFANMKLNLYDATSAGIPLKVHTTRSALTAHFFLQQYALRRGDVVVTVEPGDTVIDGGMCWGDTSLFFAHLAGEEGRVVGYEFERNNLVVLNDNLSMNPDIASRIRVRNNAVFDTTGEELRFVMAGPATAMLAPDMVPAKGWEEIRVKTLNIDDLVEEEKLKKVDFIKLDVEGAELAALHGAVNTLRRFKPKLALSAYHRVEDMYVLTSYLRSLNLGYRFWLDHFRPSLQESVIFARVD